MPTVVHLFIPANAAQPAQRVAAMGVRDGVSLSAQEVADLRATAICVAVQHVYEDSPEVTMGVVHRGFRVPSADGRAAGPVSTWLTLRLVG